MMKALFVGALVLAASGCGGEDSNRLFGSMSEVYGLDFDSVRAVRIGSSLSVEYLRQSGPASSVGKTVKLTVNLDGVPQLVGKPIDLTEIVGGLPRGVLQRVQSVTTEYPLQRGSLELDQAPDPGVEVTGRFRTTLSEPAGRTLNGDFTAKVQSP